MGQEERPVELLLEPTGYRATEVLHEGRASTVWRGEGEAGRAVAIRVYEVDPLDVDMLNAFVEEDEEPRDPLAILSGAVEPLVDLVHPGLATVLHVAGDDAALVIVEELVEGDPLERGEPVDPSVAAPLVARLARGAGAIHRRELCHGGIRPSRIRRTAGGPVLFGAGWGAFATSDLDGRLVQEKEDPDLEEDLTTEAYQAPEQIGWVWPTPPSDVFSLGAILYELLAGEHPFVEAEPHLIRDKVQHAAHLPLSEHEADVPSDLVEVVHRCLARDPADRYGSGDRLADALED